MAYFFNTKKFIAAASLVRSKKNSGLVGAGLGSRMMLPMMSMSSVGKAGIPWLLLAFMLCRLMVC